jgi:hypothetical protein
LGKCSKKEQFWKNAQKRNNFGKMVKKGNDDAYNGNFITSTTSSQQNLSQLTYLFPFLVRIAALFTLQPLGVF